LGSFKENKFSYEVLYLDLEDELNIDLYKKFQSVGGLVVKSQKMIG